MLLPRMARASADDGVERVAEQAAGATIETADIFPVPCLPEVALHELHVAPVVELVPTAIALVGKQRLEYEIIRGHRSSTFRPRAAPPRGGSGSLSRRRCRTVELLVREQVAGAPH